MKPVLNTKKLTRVVIKVGSNVLTDDKGIRKSYFNELAAQINFLVSKNIKPVIVSSGAIAAAMTLLGKKEKPKTIPQKQACAAIGQPVLMSHYTKHLNRYKLNVAQILLTQDGLENRARFINAKHALSELMAKNVIPIINENDTVTVDEIKIGDNDQLSAHVAHLIDADLLIMLSHVEGLLDKNAKLVKTVNRINSTIESLVFVSKDHKTVGGMATKLKAAKIANSFGIPAIITSGFRKNILKEIIGNKIQGTLFIPSQKALNARKHWIDHVSKPNGSLIVDNGASKALTRGKKSLLASGIHSIKGRFKIGDCVNIKTRHGKVLGKGLASYSSSEINKIKGKRSSEIDKILGYRYGDEVIHRDDMVVN